MRGRGAGGTASDTSERSGQRARVPARAAPPTPRALLVRVASACARARAVSPCLPASAWLLGTGSSSSQLTSPLQRRPLAQLFVSQPSSWCKTNASRTGAGCRTTQSPTRPVCKSSSSSVSSSLRPTCLKERWCVCAGALVRSTRALARSACCSTLCRVRSPVPARRSWGRRGARLPRQWIRAALCADPAHRAPPLPCG